MKLFCQKQAFLLVRNSFGVLSTAIYWDGNEQNFSHVNMNFYVSSEAVSPVVRDNLEVVLSIVFRSRIQTGTKQSPKS